MKKLAILAAFAALSVGQMGAAQAADVTAAIGQSGDSTLVYRLGAQWDWDSSWLQGDLGRLTGYWDLGYSYWQGDETASNHSLSFSPVLVYEFAGEQVRPYVELGIGLAAFSSTELESNDLGSSLQFEDRIGAGLRFSGQEIGLRVLHYSNAGLQQPNDGAEAYTLHYRMSY